MECKIAISKMHDYLDGELPREEILTLRAHVNSCPSCSKQLEQLEKTDAAAYFSFEAMRSESGYDAAAAQNLQERILGQLPKQKKKRNGIVRYIYRHPFLSAAVVFILVMISGLFASWSENSELIVAVSGLDSQQLVFEGNKVIVPEGAHIGGNLTVENGIIEVRGEVDGNITVIDGSMMLASTGKIAGNIRQIDQALDWFWYKITSTLSGITP
ncbi:zf-HC2 domain-containing protein [Paenibacillus sp. IITD108]